MPVTTVDPAELRRLHAAATQGPWAAMNSDVLPESALADDNPRWYAIATTYIPTRAVREKQNRADANLIVAAVNSLPVLLDRLDTYRDVPNAIQEARHSAEIHTAQCASEGDWDLEAYYRAKAEGLAEAEKIARAALDTEQT